MTATEPRRRHSRAKGRDHERRDRRAALDVLLARADRRRLSRTEAALLREYVVEEQRTGDECRKANAGSTRALAEHREAADTVIRELEGDLAEARQRAADAEQQLAAVRTVLPTQPRPRLGLPNALAYEDGRHDMADAVRDALAPADQS
ncbi:conserved hypothetical protein [Streptomyces himastatinicus ATCC 53653]|uniref:Uncharacterized protein n=1 Tax=Streptomyces himastatinicus ATCC 53653 TaxID=457427 RepID=D9WPL4_9ACTN|nr:hypothetical protein [Streptomyces himastatinicus]EFL21879.1 conserved hypothetical protein [Streptomyces himastatinicus ATCC 53653]